MLSLRFGRYSISDDVRMTLSYNRTHYSLDSDDLRIYAMGYTIEQAFADFYEDLDHAYGHYVLGDESKLGEEAKRYADYLREHIVPDTDS